LTCDEAISALKKVSPMAEVVSMTISIEGHEFVYEPDSEQWKYWEGTDDETVDDAELEDDDECRCGPGQFCPKCTPHPGRDVGT
jgi:hypothetical protein